MSIITLVRHGQASAGTSHYDRLSTLGRLQAEHLGEWWVKTGFSADAAFAGTLERQQDTASLALGSANLLDAMPVQTLPSLNEYEHDVVDKLFGQGFSSASGDSLTLPEYHGILDRWREAQSHELTDVESWDTFMQRGLSAVQHAADRVGPSGRAVLFTSGGVISTLLGNIQQHPFPVIVDNIWHIRNASVTTFLVDDSAIRLLGFNGVPHLEWHQDSTLVTMI